ncbi:MAG: hypothetical protein B7Y39_04595 [Bdellovibrio sp. 28-41-41]|nr:MAG: hypothetical protein B7Y39_04595 [Bdellovibrio sp. 28-41-41]
MIAHQNKILGIFLMVFLFLSSYAECSQVRRLRLNSESVAEIRVSTKGTIISFPSRPQKVLLGKKNSFGLEYIENDIAISPFTTTSSSNLTAYLDGRRYTFKLVTSEKSGDEIVLIRDSLERSVKIKVK